MVVESADAWSDTKHFRSSEKLPNLRIEPQRGLTVIEMITQLMAQVWYSTLYFK